MIPAPRSEHAGLKTALFTFPRALSMNPTLWTFRRLQPLQPWITILLPAAQNPCPRLSGFRPAGIEVRLIEADVKPTSPLERSNLRLRLVSRRRAKDARSTEYGRRSARFDKGERQMSFRRYN